jgi:hypothetical protein
MPRWGTRMGRNCRLSPRLRYPTRVMLRVKTAVSLVRPARMRAWSQGGYEQINGDAERSRIGEWS